MRKIVFATNNKHKLDEVRSILKNHFQVLSLNDIDCHDDIPETGTTLHDNAIQKADYIARRYGMSVFADDTGLEVDALHGAPGVYSARYAGGNGHDSEANMTKLLNELGNTANRQAQFRTVIALYLTPEDAAHHTAEAESRVVEGRRYHLFEGIVRGSIITERRGGEGFGYDPIFQPEGHTLTFAELGNDVKNTISHRARAVNMLAHFLTH